MSFSRLLLRSLAIPYGLTAGLSAQQPPVDFDREVRPILADRCFACHGPDAAGRKANLRLDTFAGATAPRKAGAAVVPKDPQGSLLIQRIVHPDPKERMPPQRSKLVLRAEEVEILRRWIAGGAEYRRTWSLVPPRRVAAAQTRRQGWARDPLDAFVLAAMERRGMQPAAAADRQTWLRRAAFVLTGLGPEPMLRAAFLADRESGARERVLDALFASPRYGERMAQDWLDLARYADTYGYQSDVHRRVWPYRDWVIDAFQHNLPYDRFLTWQLAGDLLPDASPAQRLATTFNRLHRQTNEGGSVAEEFRVQYVADRVETAATAFLGLTLGCAQCHDHKFDPVSQRDFYAMAAFFDNIDESGLYSHFTNAVPTPALDLPSAAQAAALARLRRRVAMLEARGPAPQDPTAGAAPRPRPAQAVYTLDDLQQGLRNARRPQDHRQRGKAGDAPRPVPGVRAGALAFDGENRVTLPQGNFARSQPFSFALWLKIPTAPARAVVFHRSRAWTDAGSQGYQLLLEDGRLHWALVHFWPGDAIAVRARQALPTGRWVQVAVSYDGSSRAGGLRIYTDGVLQQVEVLRDQLSRGIRGGGPTLTLAQRFRDKGLKGGAIDDFRVYDHELSAFEVRRLHGSTAATPAEINAHRQQVGGGRQLRELRAARRALARLQDRIPQIMTMVEMPRPRPTHLLARGAYDAPQEEVAADTPGALPAMDPGLPRNRLGLARWLTDPEHPLTARVAVNRLWYLVFGRGLVPTLENFGSQGQRPSHPALLDQLALDFIASGWDVQAMLRRLLLSASFGQSSAGSSEVDPDNVWLSRGPRRRLSAEMLRDQILAAAGLLVERRGGPSVRPYQPAGLWREKSGKVYRADRGEGLYRRSLYTYWKRTSPPPAMMIFDAAKRDVCVARRQQTNTPLQSLVLLNDPQVVEAARALAARVMAEAAQSVWVDRAFSYASSRSPRPAERRLLRNFFAAQLERFAADPAAARALLTVGAQRFATPRPQLRLAALTLTCSLIFNYDAVVVLR